MSLEPVKNVSGELHVFVAFDWGDEIDLSHASALGLKVMAPPLKRRPSSPFTYRPIPLYFELESLSLKLPGCGLVQVGAKVTIFDFAAVSLDMTVPLNLAPSEWTTLGAYLADPAPLIELARSWLAPLHAQLGAAIRGPNWSDLSEEFFVFRFDPGQAGFGPEELLRERASWLAGLVRLETERLSHDEESEALRVRCLYGVQDLLVVDWAAAVLVDRDCDETLQTLAFANLHLLELRHIDRRLETTMVAANKLVSRRISVLDFLIAPNRSLRAIGMLRVEATGLFERSADALKLIGDQYLARIYSLIAARFHMPEWEQTVLRTLDVAEDIYRVLADQVAARRATVLETTVVILILVEIGMGFLR